MIQQGDFDRGSNSCPHAFRNAIASRLSQHVPGRIVLHLTCLLCDAKSTWHWAAIRRQLTGSGTHE